MQKLGLGCVAQQMQFTFAQNANCEFNISGSNLWVADSKNFSTLDATGKGGLTAFPAEPGSPVYAGTPVNGLAGSATIDGHTDLMVRTCDITLTPAIEIPNDRLFNGQYGSAPERDILSVTINLGLFDQDIANMDSLYTKAMAGTPVDIVFVAGSVAGSMVEFGLNDVQLALPEHDDGSRKWGVNLNGSRAYATTTTSLDEFYLKFR